MVENFLGSHSVVKNKTDKLCSICLHAKKTRDVFSLSTNNAVEVLDLINCDLWGPYNTASTCDVFYFLTILDDYARFLWIYLLVEKWEVANTLKNFVNMVQTQFGKTIGSVRSGNGTEFICLKEYFDEKGILHQTSVAGTPQHNGRVERKHRHILNAARALRFQANLPKIFWRECVLTARYFINRTSSSLLNGKSPFELLHGHAPSYSHLTIFYCLALIHS